MGGGILTLDKNSRAGECRSHSPGRFRSFGGPAGESLSVPVEPWALRSERRGSRFSPCGTSSTTSWGQGIAPGPPRTAQRQEASGRGHGEAEHRHRHGKGGGLSPETGEGGGKGAHE